MAEKIFVYGNYIILMLHGCLHWIETELKVQEADWHACVRTLANI